MDAAISPSESRIEGPRRALAALSRLRRRLRGLRFADGAIVTFLAVACLLILSFFLDYVLDLPVMIRMLFLVSGIGGFATLAYRRLVRPLAISHEELALLVEESNPELRQSLITAVQLSRTGNEGAQYVSAQLLDAVIGDVESRIAETAFDRIFRLGRMLRKLTSLLIVMLLMSWAAAQRSDLLGIWFQRNVLLASDRWPKGTVIEDPILPETVAVGDSLLVEVRILRGEPRGVQVERLVGNDVRFSAMALREKASWDLHLEQVNPDAHTKLSQLLQARGLLDDGATRSDGPAIARIVRETIAAGRGMLARNLRKKDAKDLAGQLEADGHVVRLEGHDIYVHEFRNVSQQVNFWVEGGDDRRGPFRVDVRMRPRIDMKSMRLSYRFPDYTGVVEERFQEHGNLKVPVGTDVRYSMQTNVPVSRAFFVLDPSSASKSGRSAASESWPAAGAVNLELAEGRRFSGSFVVAESGHYYFQFEDLHGFQSGMPERFRIQAIEDRKPEVDIIEPQKMTLDVSPEAKVQIRVRVEDDYGIRRVVLEGGYVPPEANEKISQSSPLFDFRDGTAGGDTAEGDSTTDASTGAENGSNGLRRVAEREFSYEIDVSLIRTGDGARPVAGSRFEFYVLAEDFGSSGQNDADGKPVGLIGESRVHMLQIVDKESLERGLNDQLMIVRDQLRQLLGRQEAVRKNLSEFRDETMLKGSLSKKEGQKLGRHRQDQRKISEALGRQKEDVDRILKTSEENAVGDQRWKKWVGGIRDEIDQLTQSQSKAIESNLDTLRRESQDSPQKPRRVGEIVSQQRKLERDLGGLVLKLEEFGDKNAVLQTLRQVRKRQAEILDATRNKVTDGGKESK